MKKSIILKILIVLILLAICFNMTMFSYASSISDLQNQKNDAASSKADLKEQQKEVKEEKNEALSKIEEISSQISETQNNLDELTDKVKNLESSIKEKQKDLEKAEKRQKEQEEALEKRLIAQYKTGKVSYWGIILNPSSFLNFFSNIHSIERVAKIDSELIESIEKEKQTIEATKNELTTQKNEAKTAKAEAEKESVKLKNAKAIKDSEVAKLSETEKTLQQQIDEYDNQMKDLTAQIKAMQAKNASSGSGPVYTGGKLEWPVPSSHKITSPYGYRIHPIFHTNKLHAGIDIGGADWGAPFVAAEDGIVIQASDKHNGYGLCVIIDHGGGLSTLYAHGSAVYVSVGQRVTRGQKVLGIGSSGFSTGKHAHFEVRENGKAVNPVPYLQ